MKIVQTFVPEHGVLEVRHPVEARARAAAHADEGRVLVTAVRERDELTSDDPAVSRVGISLTEYGSRTAKYAYGVRKSLVLRPRARRIRPHLHRSLAPEVHALEAARAHVDVRAHVAVAVRLDLDDVGGAGRKSGAPRYRTSPAGKRRNAGRVRSTVAWNPCKSLPASAARRRWSTELIWDLVFSSIATVVAAVAVCGAELSYSWRPGRQARGRRQGAAGSAPRDLLREYLDRLGDRGRVVGGDVWRDPDIVVLEPGRRAHDLADDDR